MLQTIWFDGTFDSAATIEKAVNETCTSCRVSFEGDILDNVAVLRLYRHKDGITSDTHYRVIKGNNLLVIDNKRLTIVNEQYEIVYNPVIKEVKSSVDEKLQIALELIRIKHPNVTRVVLSQAYTAFAVAKGGEVIDVIDIVIDNKNRDLVYLNKIGYLTIKD